MKTPVPHNKKISLPVHSEFAKQQSERNILPVLCKTMAKWCLFLIIFLPVYGKYDQHFIFHWQLIHQLDENSVKILKSIPIQGIFYRFGHFSLVEETPYLERLQKKSDFEERFSSLPFELDLCYTFGNSFHDPFVKNFLNKTPQAAISFILNNLLLDWQFATAIHPGVKGIQIDLEGSHIDFGIFSDLLKEIRKKIPQARISITPMSGWIHKKEFLALSEFVDFAVPMLYDFHRGATAKDPLKVSDPKWIAAMVRHWDRFGKPIYYGLPTYSYSVMYDQTGKIKIPWAVYPPDSISQNPVFSFTGTTMNRNKDTIFKDRVLTFETRAPIKFKNLDFEAGSKMKYNFISVSSLQEMIQHASISSKSGAGLAFFRFGAPYESLVMNAQRIKNAILGNLASEILLKLNWHKTGKGSFFTLTNLGSDTWFGKTGLSIRIQGTPLALIPGDFDSISLNENKEIILEEEFFESKESLISPIIDTKEIFGFFRICGYNGVCVENKFPLFSESGVLLTGNS